MARERYSIRFREDLDDMIKTLMLVYFGNRTAAIEMCLDFFMENVYNPIVLKHGNTYKLKQELKKLCDEHRRFLFDFLTEGYYKKRRRVKFDVVYEELTKKQKERPNKKDK